VQPLHCVLIDMIRDCLALRVADDDNTRIVHATPHSDDENRESGGQALARGIAWGTEVAYAVLDRRANQKAGYDSPDHAVARFHRVLPFSW